MEVKPCAAFGWSDVSSNVSSPDCKHAPPNHHQTTMDQNQVGERLRALNHDAELRSHRVTAQQPQVPKHSTAEKDGTLLKKSVMSRNVRHVYSWSLLKQVIKEMHIKGHLSINLRVRPVDIRSSKHKDSFGSGNHGNWGPRWWKGLLDKNVNVITPCNDKTS